MTDIVDHRATPEYAREKWLCPLARVAGDGKSARCRGPECAAWRWIEIAADDPRVKEAYRKAATILEERTGKKAQHKEMVAEANEHAEEYSLPTLPEVGFCGVGGRP